MAEPFLSEIRIMSFGFAPKGWALCNGQLLPINQNQALFALLGTTYGGNGQTNFALPDLRGRVPIHVGSSHTLGEKGGQESRRHADITGRNPRPSRSPCSSSSRRIATGPRTVTWVSSTAGGGGFFNTSSSAARPVLSF